MADQESRNVKKALKGVHIQTQFDIKDFINTLYNNATINRNQTRLRRDLKAYKFELLCQTKRSLNPVFFKMRVSDNLICCSPHVDQNLEYL